MWGFFSLRLKRLLSSKVKSFKITHFLGEKMVADTFFLKLSTDKKTVTLQKARTQKLLDQHGHLVALHALKILWIRKWKFRVPEDETDTLVSR